MFVSFFALLCSCKKVNVKKADVYEFEVTPDDDLYIKTEFVTNQFNNTFLVKDNQFISLYLATSSDDDKLYPLKKNSYGYILPESQNFIVGIRSSRSTRVTISFVSFDEKMDSIIVFKDHNFDFEYKSTINKYGLKEGKKIGIVGLLDQSVSLMVSEITVSPESDFYSNYTTFEMSKMIQRSFTIKQNTTYRVVCKPLSKLENVYSGYTSIFTSGNKQITFKEEDEDGTPLVYPTDDLSSQDQVNPSNESDYDTDTYSDHVSSGQTTQPTDEQNLTDITKIKDEQREKLDKRNKILAFNYVQAVTIACFIGFVCSIVFVIYSVFSSCFCKSRRLDIPPTINDDDYDANELSTLDQLPKETYQSREGMSSRSTMSEPLIESEKRSAPIYSLRRHNRTYENPTGNVSNTNSYRDYEAYVYNK